MAIAILSEGKWKEAMIRVGGDEKLAVEEYKRCGGSFKEGDNYTIEHTRKYTAVFDPEKKKVSKPKVKAKKGKK